MSEHLGKYYLSAHATSMSATHIVNFIFIIVFMSMKTFLNYQEVIEGSENVKLIVSMIIIL